MEQIQQHEWKRIRRFVCECTKCGCLKLPTGDREDIEYSLDNGKTRTSNEPACITRPAKEDVKI